MAPKDVAMKSMNALTDLLSLVALDSVDNNVLRREVVRCSTEVRNARDSFPQEAQSLDQSIDKLISQLKDVCRDAPERNADSHFGTPERNDGYETGNRDVADMDMNTRRQQMEREFSSRSYPKIGPGYSDSISVVSDLTTPTVMPNQVVSEEEYYAGPPMHIDFSRRSSKSSTHSAPFDFNNNQQGDRRASTSELRPPSRRILSAPTGGAAATRRKNYQNTMAQLENNSPFSSPGMSRSSPVAMSAQDFPSLREASRYNMDEIEFSGSGRREAARRSLLRKSNQYAASVSATASQRMLLARQESARETRIQKRAIRRVSTTSSNTPSDFSAPSPTMTTSTSNFGGINKEIINDFGFPSEPETRKISDPVLIDEDGFIIGSTANTDLFASSSFGNGFPKESFASTADTDMFDSPQSGFFLTSNKDNSKKKKNLGSSSNRRASTGTEMKMPIDGVNKKKEDLRIDAVELATRKKLEALRRDAQVHGDTNLSSKLDFVEHETSKQIRRMRDHYK